MTHAGCDAEEAAPRAEHRKIILVEVMKVSPECPALARGEPVAAISNRQVRAETWSAKNISGRNVLHYWVVFSVAESDYYERTADEDLACDPRQCPGCGFVTKGPHKNLAQCVLFLLGILGER